MNRIFPYIFFLGLSGCTAGGPQENLSGSIPDSSTETSTMEKSYSYLALGDSYTIGESVQETERWPVALAAGLRQKGYRVNDPQIIATTGWTTDELKAGMDAAGLAGRYDLVSLLIGVNNQYRGRDAEEFRKEFIELLERAIELAGHDTSRVLVVSIPDWGVTPFAADRNREEIASAIDHFNAIKQEETLKRKVSFVDITPISRMAATDKSLVADDGLHPSGKMYGMWTEKILSLVPEGNGPLRF